MLHRIKHLLLTATLILYGAVVPLVATSASVYADSRDDVCRGVNVSAGSADCDSGTAGSAVSGLIKTALQIFQGVVGIISVFVLILAGLNYITSGGDSGKTKTAKDRILYASIGLVVVGLAQVIISFVLNRVDESASSTL